MCHEILAGRGAKSQMSAVKMACCAMSNVLGAITGPPNGNLVNGPSGNVVVETSTSHIAQQAI